MTSTHPAPGLAEVISAAMNEYVPKNLAHVLNDEPSPGMLSDYIARAVAAYLARPEIVERMARASQTSVAGLATWDDLSAFSQGMWRDGMRAAIAAVVREAGK